jgi:4-amino-4-deoxy-L-arabinose transferase-like glycosyltransferase
MEMAEISETQSGVVADAATQTTVDAARDSTVSRVTTNLDYPEGDRWGRTLETLAAPAYAIPLIAAFGALLYLLNLGGYPLYTKGEPREAVTVFDIVHGGGVILPMRAGVEIPSKPLLMHWLAAIFSLIAGGVSEWTVRLPSALCAIGGMLACYLYVRKLFEQRAGLIAALILGTTFQYVQAGTGARVDMTLTFFLELAFFEFLMIAEDLSQRVTLLYLAIAMAVLTKGPVGAVLPAIVAGIWVVIYRAWHLIPRFKLMRGLLIVGLIGGGWYLAAIVTGGTAFIHKQLLSENVYRLIGGGADYVGHNHPFYYEDLALIGGLMPWTPITCIAAVQFLHGGRRDDRRFGYLLVWFFAVLIFYNLPQSKRGVYLLALYPAASAIIAILLCEAVKARDRFTKAIAVLSRATGIVFAAAGIGATLGLAILYLSLPMAEWLLRLFGILVPELTSELRVEVAHWPVAAILIPITTIATGIYVLRSRPRLEKLSAATATGFVLIVLAIELIVEPAIAQTLGLKQFAADARKLAGSNLVGYFGILDYDFAFYNGRDLKMTSPIDPAAPTLIVSPEDDWKLVAPRLRDNYAVLLRSNPTDLDGSGRMLLVQRRASGAEGVASRRVCELRQKS